MKFAIDLVIRIFYHERSHPQVKIQVFDHKWANLRNTVNIINAYRGVSIVGMQGHYIMLILEIASNTVVPE